MDYSAYHWSEKARKYAETLGTIFNVKGRVNTVADLPATGNKIGDVYLVGLTTDTDLIEYAWLSFDNVTRWEKLGSTATSLAFSAITGSPNDNVALKNALDGKYDASNPNGYTSNVGTVTSVNNTSPDANGNVTITIPDPLPSQTGNNGKFLTTNGTSASWGVPSSFKLFHHDWFDYLLNDQSWLRADTFSWQNGTVYSNAYNHLVADVTGKTPISETIAGITIWYHLADDGHKICAEDQESNVLAIYNATGVAWYYILDQANHRFKLPRTKYGFVGLRDTVGKYVPESLPNITGSFNAGGWNDSASTSSGVFSHEQTLSNKNPQAGSVFGWKTITMNASNASSAYQDNAPVQQRSTQMYLYFYVGQYNQSATEQTAGLNSELFNGKLDIDLGNLTSVGKSYLAGLGMPSDRYDNLTLLASGQTYTAPANGMFFAGFNSCTDLSMYKLDSNNNDVYAVGGGYPSGGHNICLEVKKNDVVKLYYNGSKQYFRFIYTEGEPNV